MGHDPEKRLLCQPEGQGGGGSFFTTSTSTFPFMPRTILAYHDYVSISLSEVGWERLNNLERMRLVYIRWCILRSVI